MSKPNRSPSALRHASIGALPHPGQLPPPYSPPSLAQAPFAGGAPACCQRSAWRWSSGLGVGRLIGRSKPSNGLEPCRQPAHRRATRPSGKTIRAGPATRSRRVESLTGPGGSCRSLRLSQIQRSADYGQEPWPTDLRRAGPAYSFDRVPAERGTEHRLTKPNHSLDQSPGPTGDRVIAPRLVGRIEAASRRSNR
jgi:hypothetical protein